MAGRHDPHACMIRRFRNFAGSPLFVHNGRKITTAGIGRGLCLLLLFVHNDLLSSLPICATDPVQNLSFFVRHLFKKARRQIGGSLPIRLPRGDETLQSACPASGCLHGRIKHRIHPEALRPDADPARAPNSALRLFGKLFDPDANPITCAGQTLRLFRGFSHAPSGRHAQKTPVKRAPSAALQGFFVLGVTSAAGDGIPPHKLSVPGFRGEPLGVHFRIPRTNGRSCFSQETADFPRPV